MRTILTRVIAAAVLCATVLIAPAGAAALPASHARARANGDVTITVTNNMKETIWVGAQAAAGQPLPHNGGWALEAGKSDTFTVPGNWTAGRFWARTGCKFDGNGKGSCLTGDCGGVLECHGAGGQLPDSLAEMTLQRDKPNNAQDFYDASFVDGYNVPVTVKAVGGATNPGDPYHCTAAGCGADLNPNCPTELQKKADGKVVGCMSACEKFNTDQYCCRGKYGSSDTCKPDQWPTNYAAYFKKACPHAYSYAFDDKTSTYACTNCGYKVIFGPDNGVAKQKSGRKPARRH